MGTQQWIMVADPVIAYDLFVKQSSKSSSRPYHTFAVKIYGRNKRYYNSLSKQDITILTLLLDRIGVLYLLIKIPSGIQKERQVRELELVLLAARSFYFA
jgi:hypothetical protein